MLNLITNILGLVIITSSVIQYKEKKFNIIGYILLIVLGLGLIDII